MSRFIRGVCALIAVFVGFVALGGEIYRNDFAVRTSRRPIVDADWHTMTYRYPAPLYYDYYSETAEPYGNLERYQDGWAKQLRGLPNAHINFWARTDADAENPFGCFYITASNPKSMPASALAIHPLHNAFSNGLLRISADLRGAAEWDGKSMIRFRPMFRQAMDPNWNVNANYPLTFGIQNDSDRESPKNIVYGVGSVNGDYTTAQAYAFGSKPVDGRHWIRFIAEIDLDSKRWNYTAYDMGTVQPQLDTPLPEKAVGSYSNAHFYRDMTEATGPVTGIGVFADKINYANSGSNLIIANAVGVDNIRVEWKASDGDDYATCYENDFKTRRYRTIDSSGVTRYVTPPSVPVPVEFTSYEENADLVTKTAGETGVDGWRRISQTGDAVAIVRAGSMETRATEGNRYGFFGQTLGETITSGKVKMSVDMRTPDRWYNVSSRTMSVVLGKASLYDNTDQTALGNKYLLRVGVAGPTGSEADPGAFYPYVYKLSPQHTEVACSSNHWYRAVVVADLDGKMFDVDFFDLGEDAPTPDAEGQWICSETGRPFLDGVTTEIGTLGIFNYNSGTNSKGAEIFDNIQVWKQSDGDESWTPVYYNDFTVCRRYNRTVDEAPFVSGVVNRFSPECDAWLRRPAYYNGVPDPNAALVIAGTNRCVKCSDAQRSYGWAVQSLGSKIRHGRLAVRADIRAPYKWTEEATTASAYFAIGGDEFYQGDVCCYTSEKYADTHEFTDRSAASFGFSQSSSEPTGSRLEIVRASAYDGNGAGGGVYARSDWRTDAVAPSWYRFTANVNIDAGTYDLEVREMGRDHPDMDDDGGEVVWTQTGLGFRFRDPSGISAIGLLCKNVFDASADLTDPEAGAVLFDNILVTRDDGMTIQIR